MNNIVLPQIPASHRANFVSTELTVGYTTQDVVQGSNVCYQVKSLDGHLWVTKRGGSWDFHLYHPDWEKTEDARHEVYVSGLDFSKLLTKIVKIAARKGWPLSLS